MITPIEGLGGISPIKQTETSFPAELGSSPFAAIFQSAIQSVKDTNSDMVQSQYLLSTGQLDNPASLMIAMTKFESATSLLIQLRNKALDAYSELTRMSI